MSYPDQHNPTLITKDYRNDLESFVDDCWATEDFTSPKTFEGLRGSRVETLPKGEPYEVNYIQCEYEVDHEVVWNIIEQEVASMFSKEFAKLVDEEIIRTLLQNTNPVKLEDKYYGYDTAMSAVINMTGV